MNGCDTLSYGTCGANASDPAYDSPADAVFRLLVDKPTPTAVLLQTNAATMTGEISTVLDHLTRRLSDHFAVPVIHTGHWGNNETRIAEPPCSNTQAWNLGTETVRIPATQLLGTLTVPSLLLERVIVVTVVATGADGRTFVSALGAQAALLKQYNKMSSSADLACEAHRIARSDALLAVGSSENKHLWWVVTDDDIQLERLLVASSGITPGSWPPLRAITRTFVCDIESPLTVPFPLRLSGPSFPRVFLERFLNYFRHTSSNAIFVITAARQAVPRIVAALRRRIQH